VGDSKSSGIQTGEIVCPLVRCLLRVRGGGGGGGSINSIPPGSLPGPFSTDERRIGASRLRVLLHLDIKKVILDSNVVTSRYSGKWRSRCSWTKNNSTIFNPQGTVLVLLPRFPSFFFPFPPWLKQRVEKRAHRFYNDLHSQELL